MAVTKNYRTVVPAPPGTDLTVMRWLVRESFDLKAASEGLTITDYTETQLTANDLTPATKTKEQSFASRLFELIFPVAPADTYQWFEFKAVATNA